jgi:hypothetical protein
VQLEQATATANWMEPALAARRWEAAEEGGTAVAVMGIRGAERAADPSSAGAAGLEVVIGLDMAAVTVEATEGGRPAEEATMLAAEATAAMVQVAAAMAAMVVQVAPMAPVKGTPEVGYLPAEGTLPEAKNDRTRSPAERRRTTSTGKPVAAEPAAAAAAAARSPPAAARRMPPAVAAEGAGRDPRTRSPSAPPRATASTAAVSRARAGRGSAAPRRRPDLPPAGRTQQLSGLRATEHSVAPPGSRGSDSRASRSRPPHASGVGGARQITPRWTEAARQWAQRHQTKQARGSHGQRRKIRASPGGEPSCPM